MKKAFLLSFLIIPQLTWAKCELPKAEVLKIGCAYECGLANSLRLKIAAMRAGYKLELIDMNSDLTGIADFDGILIPGGADIHPRFFLDRVDKFAKKRAEKFSSYYRPSAEGEVRDVFELQVLKEYNNNEYYSQTPLLGICRGMQLMGVSQGLPLYQDIQAELGIANREWLFDKVDIPQGPTLMSSLFPSGSFWASKKHHQSVNGSYYNNHHKIFPQIKISAFSHERKIIEAIEYTHRPALGVQFHPEYSLPSPIFEWFLSKACEKKIIN